MSEQAKNLINKLKGVLLIVYVGFGLLLESKIPQFEKMSDFFYNFAKEVMSSFSDNHFYSILVLVFVSVLYRQITKIDGSEVKKLWPMSFAILFAIVYLVGDAFSQTNTAELLFGSMACIVKTVVRFLAFSIFFYWCLIYAYIQLDRIMTLEIESEKANCSLKKLTLGLFVCWVPYLIIFYPGMLYTDSVTALLQWNGYEHEMSNYTVMIENSQLSNHHPIFTTALYGLSADLGKLLGDAGIGIFLFCLLQQLLVAFCVAYFIYQLQDWDVSAKGIRFLRMFYVCVPFFGLWTATVIKDVLLTAMMLLYSAQLIKLVKQKGAYFRSIVNWFTYVGIGILMSLMKNQGIYYFVITSVILLIVYWRKCWLQICTSLMMVVLLFDIWNNVLLPEWKVASVGKQEAMALMIQQTAYYVVCNKDEMTEDEKRIINEVLPYEEIPQLYNPESSDPVKFRFKQDATDEEVSAYKKLWLQHMFKDPLTYLEASINNFYGYYYPSIRRTYVYFDYPESGWFEWDDKVSVERPDFLSVGRILVQMLCVILSKLPVICLLFYPGFYGIVFLGIMGYGCYKKKWKEMLIMMPLILTFLVNMVSPENANWRYTIPVVFMLPFMIALFLRKMER